MLLAILSFITVTTASAASTDVRLDAGSVSGSPGATVFIPIELAVNSRGLGAIVYYISYDATRLELVNVAAGAVLPIPVTPPIGDNPLRVLSVDLGGAGAATGITGTLATVEFRIRDTAPNGATTVGLTVYDASGPVSDLGERTYSSVSGSVTVTGGTGGGNNVGTGTYGGNNAGTGTYGDNYEAAETDGAGDTDNASETERAGGGILPRAGIESNTLLFAILAGVALLIAIGTIIVLVKRKVQRAKNPTAIFEQI